MKKMNIGLLVIGALILACGFTWIFVEDLMKEASTYSTFEESGKSDRSVHIVGEWVDRNNSDYDPEKDVFRFQMLDSVGGKMTVLYNNPMPENFEAAEKVVVVGKNMGEYFQAGQIVTKCPSKYGETDITGKESESRPSHPAQ